MLNQKTFITGMQYLKNFYIKWEFDLTDRTKLEVWYGFLSALDEADFTRIIETYCTTNIHAPQSPNDLIMILVEEDEKNYADPYRAFALVRQLIRDNGWQYGRQDIYDSIKGNPALYKTVKDMEPELRELTADDKFLPERFRKEYAIQLKAMCIRNRNAKLSNQQLPPSDPAGFLPYEQ